MTKKTTKILNFFTFGLLGLIASKKAKKYQNVNQALTLSNKLDIDYKQLIAVLGGKNNIIGLNSSLTSITINVKQIHSLDKNSIKNFCAKGLFITDNKITLIIGDNAKALEQAIRKEIEND